MALSDVSQRCKATSDLGATADIGRPYGLDGSVAFDPIRDIGRLLNDLCLNSQPALQVCASLSPSQCLDQASGRT
jgi:hypothetical protein